MDLEEIKLKKELDGMNMERDQTLHVNIELDIDNSNLKVDVKKLEDREASQGGKLKREKDSTTTQKVEVDKLKKLVARAEEERGEIIIRSNVGCPRKGVRRAQGWFW